MDSGFSIQSSVGEWIAMKYTETALVKLQKTKIR